MFISSYSLLIPLFISSLNGADNGEIFEKLSYQKVQDISCLIGLCFVAEGCSGNPIWRRVLEWPKWETAPKDCLHAFMIRKNVDPARAEMVDQEIMKMLEKKGEEYFIVMASGGPNGPAREMRLETCQLKLIFTMTHEELRGNDKKRTGNKFTLDSYEYQKIDKYRFEAGVLARIKYEPKKKEKGEGNSIIKLDEWEDYCIFMHGSQSMQHLCGGLERLFQRLPSKDSPMQFEDCTGIDEDQFVNDKDNGFFVCKPVDKSKPEDFVLKVETDGMEYVKMHYAFCVAGKTVFLVEHHEHGYHALQYTTEKTIECGDITTPIKDRCKVPDIPSDVIGYCGDRCEKGGKTLTTGGDEILGCSFLDTVIDGTIYGKDDMHRKGDVPSVKCDASGWWRYKQAGYEQPGVESKPNKWIKTFFCFYPQSRLYSDCVLDRFQCGKYGDCPVNRQHQVDCDENEPAGLVLAVYHEGLEHGYKQVKKLECDKKNRWWTVDGKSVPHTAHVECVYPFELEIMKRAATIQDWDPAPVAPRAISEIGSTVRIASMLVAGLAGIGMIAGIIIAKTRLQGPKTRMLTRRLRSFYPSLLNEQERTDKAKASAEYKSVDNEAAGLALHLLLKKVMEETKFVWDGEKLELHTHWISLTWPKRNLLLERALLHRAFFGLKILYRKFQLPENDNSLANVRPGLREQIFKACREYKVFVEQWNSSELVYSLAFATLSNADLEAFRRNEVKRKILRRPVKDNKSSVVQIETDAPDVSNKAVAPLSNGDGAIPTVNTGIAPTLDDTATATDGMSKGKEADEKEKEKIEEVTAPPQDKE